MPTHDTQDLTLVMPDDLEDELGLSADTLAALQHFYLEQDIDLRAFEDLKSSTDESGERKLLSISAFKEDWNASQFWFTDDTAEFLARQLLLHSTSESSIAIISAPSIFLQAQKLLLTGQYPLPTRLCLLEYDERFDLLEGFVKYDFNDPTNLPADMDGQFDLIVCDPAYHSEACIVQYAKSCKWLTKAVDVKSDRSRSIKMVCTGEALQDVVTESFAPISITSFHPRHTVRLDNRYACYANFELEIHQDL
ncbi:uncharacterized protein HMPREF1541_03060 [Cyphellophora europaea CBS 101466]|uniref:Protein-lysine N-methyltransferase EFM5 n=1 Tax=Cyphellophora europaea (strain CBS 101466) TaxID=1220924 RepID=W2RXS3_CYPE1|nr:uncharacterized protein HMPREF1541_03060 [Cyphellophora europaea CBS 101466]ETN41125.1 hypothetical protein HMPREF1541_03060 [Cyphellophora europaea CBS 101466]